MAASVVGGAERGNGNLRDQVEIMHPFSAAAELECLRGAMTSCRRITSKPFAKSPEGKVHGLSALTAAKRSELACKTLFFGLFSLVEAFAKCMIAAMHRRADAQ
jgi:hypothetical protein